MRKFLLVIPAALVLGALMGCSSGAKFTGSLGNNGGIPAGQPAVTSLSPSTVVAGGPAFTLTLTGVNFSPGLSVYGLYDLGPVVTTYVSPTEMQAQIPAADIAVPGTYTVVVTQDTLNFGATLTVTPASLITSISPSMVLAGGSAFTLTVDISGFTTSSASTILWNGTPLPTAVVSYYELQAQVPAADIAMSGTATISVNGASNTESFTIESNNGVTFSSVAIQANDMVWDPISQQIYLSVPSSNGANGNTITALNPFNGQLGISQNAGGAPDMLALASDGSYLYAGIDGATTGSIQRFTLPNLGMDINIPLGSDIVNFGTGTINLGPYHAMDVEAAPGSPHTIAVVRSGPSGGSSDCGVVIYDDALARPTSVPSFTQSRQNVDSIQWGSDDTQIYGEDNEDTGFDFYVLSVNSSGVQVTNDYPGVFNAMYAAKLHYDATTGYVYSDGGQAVNPDTGKTMGTYADASGVMCSSTQHQYGGVGCVMVPDGTLGFAYFLGKTQAQTLAGGSDYTLEAFDLTTFAPINSMVIPNVAGTPVKLVRWGTNGLAFLMRSTNQSNPGPVSDVYLIRGTFVTNP